MNMLVENGTLEEVEYGSNFAYILRDNGDFLSTEYKVMQSQTNSNFIKCMKLLYNGRIELYYLVNSYKSLASLLPCLDPEHFITVVGNLLTGIIDVKNNGFLSCHHVDHSFERIYVDQSTYKIGLIYLPLNKHEYHDTAAFENALRTSLVRVISQMGSLSSPKTIQLASDLQNGTLSIEELCAKIGGKTGHQGKGPVVRERVDTLGDKDQADARLTRPIRLIALNAPSREEIVVNKPEFVIGKKDTNDGIVTFNKMISRVHCKIICNGGKFMIRDMGSANGTYVNGFRVPPEKVMQLKNGDIVRLANSEFRVVMD